MAFRSSFFVFSAFVVVCVFLVFPNSASAATKTWTGTTNGNWATGSNWGGTAPNAGDDLVFPSSASNKSTSNNIAAGTSFNSITFTGTGYTLATNSITLPAGGITSNISGGSNTISLAIALSATTTVTVTNSNETLTLSGIISDGGSAYGLIKTGAGQLTLSGANTFTGGLTIKAGTVLGSTSVNAFGANSSTITIGDTSGTAAATLYGYSSLTYANPIAVVTGSGGLLSITNGIVGNSPVFSGAVTINNNLTISTPTYGAVTISGGITGTGNVILSNGGITLSTGTVNFTGTITNSGTGTGDTTISSVIGTNVTGVIENDATSKLVLTGANTFTSGITIKAGTVYGNTSANAFGANTSVITIGDTSGTAAATLTGNLLISTGTFANPITVATGSSGVLAIVAQSSNTTFSGAVTLNNSLTLGGNLSSHLILSGGITGTGNLTLKSMASYATVTLSTVSVNFTGTITNNASGNGTTTISAPVGANVTTITQNSTTSPLTVSGQLTTNSSAGTGYTTTLINTPGVNSVLTLSGGVNTTATSGNLVLQNNSSSAGGINFTTTAVNNKGTVTNSGTGSGSVTISAVIDTNVTGVIQNSATSGLVLTGVNTFASGLNIWAGEVDGQTSASAFGAATITMGYTSGSAATTLVSNISTVTNPISVASGNSGIATVQGHYATFNGAITLNSHNLILTNYSTGYAKFGGGITGTGNITITNTNTNGVTIQTGSINNTGSITNNGSGTGTNTISAVIGTNVTGVIQNSGTSALTLSADNTFTSGLTIKAGTVNGAGVGTKLGASSSVITIGDTSGTANAALNSYNNGISNPITVASGSSGILSIGNYAGSNTILNGTITLNNNLTIISNPYIGISGGITGTGNLIINNTSTATTAISSGSVNNTGTITNSGSGSGTTTISAVIGTNVTGLTQNSSTSKLLLSGNNSTVSGNVGITSGTLELSGTTNLNVAGNWTNAGTFTGNSSTVTLTGTNQTISGVNTFYNLSKTVAAQYTLTFKESVKQTITHTLTLQGASTSNRLLLRSAATNTQWQVDPQSTRTIAYLDVQDSNNTNASAINATGTSSLDSGNNTGWTGLTSSNQAPTVDTVNIANASYDTAAASISLTENTTKTVYIWGVATDNDTCEQIDTTSQYVLKFYRTNVGSGDACGADNNNCYSAATATTVDQCSAGGSDKTARYQFALPVYYYADPTDTGAPQAATTWTAKVTVTDDNAAAASNTSTTEMASLVALNVSASVDYGTVALGNISAQKTATITNTGNRAIDATIYGDGAMSCSNIGSIAIGETQYSLSTGFTFGTATSVTTSPVNIISNTIKTTTGAAASTPLYMLQEIPVSGISGTCGNTLTFTAQAH